MSIKVSKISNWDNLVTEFPLSMEQNVGILECWNRILLKQNNTSMVNYIGMNIYVIHMDYVCEYIQAMQTHIYIFGNQRFSSHVHPSLLIWSFSYFTNGQLHGGPMSDSISSGQTSIGACWRALSGPMSDGTPVKGGVLT